MRVLIVEPDTDSARHLYTLLKHQNIVATIAPTGGEGIRHARSREYAACITELELPDVSGLDLIKAVRVERIDTPIVVVARDMSVEAQVSALDAGADAFIAKPFHKALLLAHLNAVVRRAEGHASPEIRAQTLTLNVRTHTVLVGSSEVSLTDREFRLLECLMLRKDSMVTKRMLLHHIYGDVNAPEQETIAVFLSKVRKKLADASDGRSFIKTVWGRGYTISTKSDD
jgi:two-component system, cell cycle response regulator CtrA